MVTRLGLAEKKGYAILGVYSSLVYGLQIFGGLIADRFLGFRKSIILGSVLMILGHILLALPISGGFFPGLSFIAWGSGFFSGSDTAIAGTLYPRNEQFRKDSGFILFYMITNIGMALGGLICGYIGEKLSWHWGFGVAGIFMVLGLFNFIWGIPNDLGKPPNPELINKKILGIRGENYVYLGSVSMVILTVLLFIYPGLMDGIIYPLIVVSFLYVLFIAYKSAVFIRYKLIALLLLFFVYAFWLALYEQSTGALNLFILRNVNLNIGSWKIPGLAINNFIPSFLLILLTPLALLLWKLLLPNKKKIHSVVKLIIGIVATGLFFGVLWIGSLSNSSSGLVPIGVLILGYFFMEIGEICIAPTIITSTYNLSPVSYLGTMMGIAAISGALGEFLAGKIGSTMAIPKNIINPAQSLPYYTHTFLLLAIFSFIFALLYIALFPTLKRWMREIN